MPEREQLHLHGTVGCRLVDALSSEGGLAVRQVWAHRGLVDSRQLPIVCRSILYCGLGLGELRCDTLHLIIKREVSEKHTVMTIRRKARGRTELTFMPNMGFLTT